MDIEILVTDCEAEAQWPGLRDCGEDVFGMAVYGLTWRPKELHLTAFVEGEAVSHVGLLRHALLVGSERVPIAGVGGVVTLPKYQKQGIARRLLDAARPLMRDDMEADFGYLFCRPPLVEFYRNLSWQLIEAPVFFDQPNGRVESPLRCMVLPLKDHEWPGGEVEMGCFPW